MWIQCMFYLRMVLVGIGFLLGQPEVEEEDC